MIETNDIILQQDLEELVNGSTPFDVMNHKTVFITGVTGLIGSQIARAILCFNRITNANIKVVGLARNQEKTKQLFGELLERDDFSVVYGDILSKIEYEGDVDYIVHGASATDSKYFVEHPVETIRIAIDGTTSILEFAKEKKVSGFLYLSSLEVYGVPNGKEYISESDYGYIDPLSVRSSYSEGKRMVECLCVSYGSEYNIPVKIARLSQTFGTGVEYGDKRVFAEFARCSIERKNIVLHTLGNTVRSYCYTKDAISALIYILIKGEELQAYNVTNMNTSCSIAQMAQLVCDLYDDRNIEVEFDIAEDISKFGYNPEMIIRLDTKKLESLGWKPTVDLKEMFERTIKSIEYRYNK